jgi:hypothetical protein
LVTCSAFELAGVGNANATGSLQASYTATVQCRNHGGQIVEVKSQVTGAAVTTGSLSPKNADVCASPDGRAVRGAGDLPERQLDQGT